jgi:hypothetical protein
MARAGARAAPAEVDLRHMLRVATGYHRDVVRGRWVIGTKHPRRQREIVKEPDIPVQRLMVVIAYPLGGCTVSETYLEVTFKSGRPVAGYFYLPRHPVQKSYRSKRVEAGLVVDFSRGGRPIGIEITAPGALSLKAFNRVLADLGLPALRRDDLAPLLAA